MRCPSCSAEVPGQSKFCLECGTRLNVESVPQREERKVVSVLFCDLVGFTAASEAADPEDVRTRLRAYHTMLRERIESFGGTVEKFVGDAVMAVFGAPVSHEDDAERAVRAGLAILSAIEELGSSIGASLSVRIGINTGEVVVALGARPELGEGFVTGDVVNTAARIQSAAPVGGVAVGAATHDATSRVFAYEALDAVSVKGKTDPVALWRAGAPRARLGTEVTRSTDAPLVGRELEVLQLHGMFDRVARDGSVHLVTLTGEPGAGKSRLVAELFSYVDGREELVTWRTGRCLPYGDGVTFWALGEIVKAHAGILETDGVDVASAKLSAVLPASDDASWLHARLLPLLGITTGTREPSVSKEESFAAWRRFLESIAATGPSVLVFEDVHWADPSLLDFIQHLASWVHGLPMLLVCTARPELFDSQPGWGSGLRNTATLSVGPLGQKETATVVSQLLGLPVVPATTQQLILQRAEGNPLWVEECVRVLRERDLIDTQGRLRGNEIPLPQGVQALIAARLDTLPSEHKAMLGDAAVVGRVFWPGAVARLGGGDTDEVLAALHELTAKEFVRPLRESTLAGEPEFAFWHGLVRDVAYTMLPRSVRASRHLAVSEWLAQQIGDRVADLAEILAEHTSQALELATAVGDSDLIELVTPCVQRYAVLAALKALPLDSARAMAQVDRALGLTRPEDPDYADVLVLWGRAAGQVGRPRDAVAAFHEASGLYEERGDLLAAGSSLRDEAGQLLSVGDRRGRELLSRSIRLLDGMGPSREICLSLLRLAVDELNLGAPEAALGHVRRVESLAVDDDEVAARAHAVRGAARCRLGDLDGLAEIERSIEGSVAADLAQVAGWSYQALAATSLWLAGPGAASEPLDSGETFCESRGLIAATTWLRVTRVEYLAQVGRLDDAAALADELLMALDLAGDDAGVVDVSSVEALVLIEIRGSSQAPAERALAAARRTGYPLHLALAHTVMAVDALARGEAERADSHLGDLWETADIEHTSWATLLHRAVDCCAGTGNLELARDFVSRAQAAESPIPGNQHSLLMARAVLAHAEVDYRNAIEMFAAAANEWERFSNRLDQAHALLGLARSSSAAGHPDALRILREALNLFTGMGARYRIQQCERLLADAHEARERPA